MPRSSRSASSYSRSRSRSGRNRRSRSRSSPRAARNRRSRSRSYGFRRERDGSFDDSTYNDARLHISDLTVDCSKREIEERFAKYGALREVWVARNPPCFAFVVYNEPEDARRAMKKMDGTTLCGNKVRVTVARPRTRGTRRANNFDPNMRCYTCGQRGHFSRECPNSHRSYNRSRSYSRSRSRDRRSRRRDDSRKRNRKSVTPERKRGSRRRSVDSRDNDRSVSRGRGDRRSSPVAASNRKRSPVKSSSRRNERDNNDYNSNRNANKNSQTPSPRARRGRSSGGSRSPRYSKSRSPVNNDKYSQQRNDYDDYDNGVNGRENIMATE